MITSCECPSCGNMFVVSETDTWLPGVMSTDRCVWCDYGPVSYSVLETGSGYVWQVWEGA